MFKTVFFLFLIASNIYAYESYSNKGDLLGDTQTSLLLNNYPIFEKNYKSYQVDTTYNLEHLKHMEVVILFGTWCHDSKREVPRMLKILDSISMLPDQISLIALDRNKTEPKDRHQTYNLKYTPTFIFFQNGFEIGRIVEKPSTSLENDLAILPKSLESVVVD